MSAAEDRNPETRARAEDSQLGFFFEEAAVPAPQRDAPQQVLAAARRKPRANTLPAWAAAAMPDTVVAEEDDSAAERRVWRVSALVADVREHIERSYAEVWVRGEISNLRAAPSGHIYFTLKDGEAQLPAVLFRRQAQLLRFHLADGLEVLLQGRVSVYEQRGQMQLIANSVEPVGAGSLQLAFEQLKRKLGEEGLFAAERKRPLPPYPCCVGIVTSPAGAVIRDFLNVTARRHAALDVLLYPAAVQGDSAAAEIVAGIAWFNRERNVDVIVVARGGGSLEDLAAFNSERVARAIAASDLPVVAAIGHETDFTIADFVADLRAPTPSAAAELITAAQHRIEEHLEALDSRLHRAVRYQLSLAQGRIARTAVAASAMRMRDALGRRAQRVDEYRFCAERAQATQFRTHRDRLQRLNAALARHEAPHRLALMRERCAALQARLGRAGHDRIAAGRHRAAAAERGLATLSPTAVLGRGYALVFAADGRLLRDAAEARGGDAITARLAQGLLRATVTDEDTYRK